MEDNSIRNVKFKKLILLILRIGIISALALMLSRPVTRGFIPGWLSTEIDTRLLIIIDNSSSMNSYIEGKPSFDKAIETAKELLEIYKDIYHSTATINHRLVDFANKYSKGN